MSYKHHLFTKSIFNVYICLFIYATFVINVSTQEWGVDDDGCRTPDRGVGICKQIKTCEPIMNFIRNSPKPIPPIPAGILRNYQCGVEDGKVKVCCPNSTTIASLASFISIPNDPPDITNHNNFNLLPMATCGPLPNDDKILGGDNTSLYEFPWMALIAYETSKGPDFRCGGTIINERYILTAAHCITNLSNDLKLLNVRVGEHDINSDEDCEETLDGRVCAPPVQDLNIEQVIPHFSYNTPPFQHDVGLIRVNPPINLGVKNAKAVCLPTTENDRNYNFENRTVTITGWGATETGRASSKLLKVDVPTMLHSECENKYGRQANITQRQLCAGGRNQKDSCQGDSGGPLQRVSSVNKKAKYVQYGIVSFGPTFCGTEGNPGVYTKIAYYMNWLLDNMKP